MRSIGRPIIKKQTASQKRSTIPVIENNKVRRAPPLTDLLMMFVVFTCAYGAFIYNGGFVLP